MSEFSNRLRHFRKANYMTQNDLATMCSLAGRASGVSFSVQDISNYENGRALPTAAKAKILCKVVRMRISTYNAYTGKAITTAKSPAVRKPNTRRYKGGASISITINN